MVLGVPTSGLLKDRWQRSIWLLAEAGTSEAEPATRLEVSEKAPRDVGVRTERVEPLHAEERLKIVVRKRQQVSGIEIEGKDGVPEARRLDLAAEVGR